MFTRKALRLEVVALGCGALVFALSGCASFQKEARTESGTIEYGINKDLTRGFSLSEYQGLTERNRKIYDAERHNDVYPEHQGTNGRYVMTPDDEGRIWHWGS